LLLVRIERIHRDTPALICLCVVGAAICRGVSIRLVLYFRQLPLRKEEAFDDSVGSDRNAQGASRVYCDMQSALVGLGGYLAKKKVCVRIESHSSSRYEQ